MTNNEGIALHMIQCPNQRREQLCLPRPALARTQVHRGGTARIQPPDRSPHHIKREVERWFLELRDPVFRYLRSLGCHPSLAEEMTQEAFLRLYRSFQDGLEVSEVRAWVFRVVRNLWIDSRREHQRYSTSQDEGKPTDLTPSDSSPDPEQQVLQRERTRLIEEAVRRLPELERECLHLRAQGLRYYEIALALDISKSAAVECVRRAVKRLRKIV